MSIFIEEETHVEQCEAQPEGQDCICLEVKQEKYDQVINNQIDDLAIDLMLA